MLMRSTQAWRIESSALPASEPTVEEASAWCASAAAASCAVEPEPLDDEPFEDDPPEVELLDDEPLDEPELLPVLALASDDVGAPPSFPPLLDAPWPLDPPMSKPVRSVDDRDALHAGATRAPHTTAARQARCTSFAYHRRSAPALHAWGQVLTPRANLALAANISDVTGTLVDMTGAMVSLTETSVPQTGTPVWQTGARAQLHYCFVPSATRYSLGS
jgi:hypothetical protein